MTINQNSKSVWKNRLFKSCYLIFRHNVSPREKIQKSTKNWKCRYNLTTKRESLLTFCLWIFPVLFLCKQHTLILNEKTLGTPKASIPSLLLNGGGSDHTLKNTWRFSTSLQGQRLLLPLFKKLEEESEPGLPWAGRLFSLSLFAEINELGRSKSRFGGS